MTYRDPYVAPDGPIARLAAKMVGYDGSMPSSIFTPRERWKVGQTSNSAIPSQHDMVYQGEVATISSETDFCAHSKHHAWPLNLNIKLGNMLFCEAAGYPHMRPDQNRDQRRLTIMHDVDIPETMSASLPGRTVREFVDMPPWLDDVMGWRKILLVSPDGLLIIDHQQWENDKAESA